MCSWFWCWSLCSGGIPPSPPACSSVPQAVWLRGGVSLTSVQTFNRFYLTSHLCAAAPLSAIFGYFVCTLTDRCGPSPCASPATASSTSLWFLFLLKNQSSERCQAETFLRWMSSKPLWGQRQQGAEGLFKAMSARLGQNSCGWAVGTLRKTTRCYPAGMREVWLWRHDSGLTAIKICLKKMDPLCNWKWNISTSHIPTSHSLRSESGFFFLCTETTMSVLLRSSILSQFLSNSGVEPQSVSSNYWFSPQSHQDCSMAFRRHRFQCY